MERLESRNIYRTMESEKRYPNTNLMNRPKESG